MSDTTVTTEAPISAPTSPPPLPNDPAARSPTGEILEPSQIKPSTTETTPKLNADGTPASTSTPPDQTAKPADGKAPDAYDFKAPEGYTVDSKLVDEVTPIFKEMGLNQDQAQKLFDVHTKALIDAAKAPTTAYETMRTDWQAKVKADPDLAKATNGDKTGLDAVKLDIGRALNAIGDAALVTEFKSAMDLTGAGDHPAFVKALWKLSQHITEGKHVAGGNPSPHGQRAPGTTDKPSPAAALYPNLR